MKTTEQWLVEIKQSSAKLAHWLTRQYIGEALAASRLDSLMESPLLKFADDTTGKARILGRIAVDEATHRDWIGELLTTRGIPLPAITYAGDRYWEPILKNLTNFEELAGAGHHAEKMRLIRIRALCSDNEIDSDIRSVFQKILPDEIFHTAAFAHMSTPQALESTADYHTQGLNALGLLI
jgi:hypothetical protein